MRGVLHGGLACYASSGLGPPRAGLRGAVHGLGALHRLDPRVRREELLGLLGAARDLDALRRGDHRVRRDLLLELRGAPRYLGAFSSS